MKERVLRHTPPFMGWVKQAGASRGISLDVEEQPRASSPDGRVTAGLEGAQLLATTESIGWLTLGQTPHASKVRRLG